MNILFVTDKYYPKPLANAICVQKVAEHMAHQNDNVVILAYKDFELDGPETKSGVKVHYVKPDLRLRLFYSANNFPERKSSRLKRCIAIAMNRLKRCIYYPFFPLYSLQFPYRIYKKIVQLNSIYKFDIIVCTYAQLENLIAGMWFKQKHPQVKVSLYALDTFIHQKFSFLKRKKNFWLRRALPIFDQLIYMRSRYKELISCGYEEWENKMFPADIPLLTINEERKDYINNLDEEVWVYAGATGLPHYPIEDVIKIFLALPNNKKRSLIFYTNGIALEYLKDIEKQTKGRIRGHSYIPHDQLCEVLSKADVLVSIKYTDQISAKIFEYISNQKIVVHFSGIGTDPNVSYIENYKKGIVVPVYKYSTDEIPHLLSDKLNQVINESNCKNLDFSYFEMNTPDYTAKLIRNYKSSNE